MTATPDEDARAAQAQAAGQAAAAGHESAAQQQHQASGSAIVIEDAGTPDDISVDWIPSGDSAAQPTLNPSPPPVGQYENHGPPAA